jgi:hypothetical protein
MLPKQWFNLCFIQMNLLKSVNLWMVNSFQFTLSTKSQNSESAIVFVKPKILHFHRMKKLQSFHNIDKFKWFVVGFKQNMRFKTESITTTSKCFQRFTRHTEKDKQPIYVYVRFLNYGQSGVLKLIRYIRSTLKHEYWITLLKNLYWYLVTNIKLRPWYE